ncbi:MAG: hypothetical protein DMF55_07165 [Acidobacteria bacterium]|nr:MAG: hypothetical protein DMF55_07165 [Acidobacteriota bacterium]
MPRRFLVFLAVGAYLIFRLPAITGLPIFVDESTYLHWADLVRRDPARNAFVSMIDPKPPLHVWLLALVLGLGRNPLVSGRLLSVAAGALALPMFIGLAGRLQRTASGRSPPSSGGSPRASATEWCAAALFVTSPYLAFSQRMALVESLFLLEEIAIAGLSVAVADAFREPGTTGRRRWNLWILLGLALGAAFLTRQNISYVLLGLPVLAILLFSRADAAWRRWRRLLIGMAAAMAIAVLVWVPALVLESDPDLPHKDLKTKVFYHLRYSSETSLASRPAVAKENAVTLFLPFERAAAGGLRYRRDSGWFWTYLTPPLAILSLAALLGLAFGRRRRAAVFLLAWALLLLAPLVVFGGVLYSRYAVAGAVPLLLASALALGAGISAVSRRGTPAVVLGTVAGAGLFFLAVADCVRQLREPLRQRFVASDRLQYVSGWTAGAAVESAARAIRERKRPVVVVNVVGLAFPNIGLAVLLRNAPGVQMHFVEWTGVLADLADSWPVGRTLHLRNDYRPWKPPGEIRVPDSSDVVVVSPDPVLSVEEGRVPVESLVGGFRRWVAETRRYENPPMQAGGPAEAGVKVLLLRSVPRGRPAAISSPAMPAPDSSSSATPRSARLLRKERALSEPAHPPSRERPIPLPARTSR